MAPQMSTYHARRGQRSHRCSVAEQHFCAAGWAVLCDRLPFFLVFSLSFARSGGSAGVAAPFCTRTLFEHLSRAGQDGWLRCCRGLAKAVISGRGSKPHRRVQTPSLSHRSPAANPTSSGSAHCVWIRGCSRQLYFRNCSQGAAGLRRRSICRSRLLLPRVVLRPSSRAASLTRITVRGSRLLCNKR
jgi:hypothetical protein